MKKLFTIIFLLFQIHLFAQNKPEIGTNKPYIENLDLERDTTFRNELLKINLKNYIGKSVVYLLENETIKKSKFKYYFSARPPFKLTTIHFVFAPGLEFQAQVKKKKKKKFATISDYKNDTILKILIDKAEFEKKVKVAILENNKVELYFFKSMKADSMLSYNCNYLPQKHELNDTAFISNTDIIAYDTSVKQNQFVLTKESMNALNKLTLNENFPKKIPFAVVVNNKPAFCGIMVNMYEEISDISICNFITTPLTNVTSNILKIITIDNSDNRRGQQLLNETLLNSNRILKK